MISRPLCNDSVRNSHSVKLTLVLHLLFLYNSILTPRLPEKRLSYTSQCIFMIADLQYLEIHTSFM